MKKFPLTAAAILGVLMLSPVNAAELKVLAGGSMTASLKELGPRFEKATGHRTRHHVRGDARADQDGNLRTVRPRRGAR